MRAAAARSRHQRADGRATVSLKGNEGEFVVPAVVTFFKPSGGPVSEAMSCSVVVTPARPKLEYDSDDEGETVSRAARLGPDLLPGVTRLTSSLTEEYCQQHATLKRTVREGIQNWNDEAIEPGGRPRVLGDPKMEVSQGDADDVTYTYRDPVSGQTVGYLRFVKSGTVRTASGRVARTPLMYAVNYGADLPARIFKMGATTKRGPDTVRSAGKFGEGIKIAALGAIKGGAQMTHRTGNTIWRWKTVLQDGEKVLVADTSARRGGGGPPAVELLVEGIGPDDFNPLDYLFLVPPSDPAMSAGNRYVSFRSNPADLSLEWGALYFHPKLVKGIYIRDYKIRNDPRLTVGVNSYKASTHRDRTSEEDPHELSSVIFRLWTEAVETDPQSYTKRFYDVLEASSMLAFRDMDASVRHFNDVPKSVTGALAGHFKKLHGTCAWPHVRGDVRSIMEVINAGGKRPFAVSALLFKLLERSDDFCDPKAQIEAAALALSATPVSDRHAAWNSAARALATVMCGAGSTASVVRGGSDMATYAIREEGGVKRFFLNAALLDGTSPTKSGLADIMSSCLESTKKTMIMEVIEKTMEFVEIYAPPAAPRPEEAQKTERKSSHANQPEFLAPDAPPAPLPPPPPPSDKEEVAEIVRKAVLALPDDGATGTGLRFVPMIGGGFREAPSWKFAKCELTYMRGANASLTLPLHPSVLKPPTPSATASSSKKRGREPAPPPAV